MSYEDMPGEDQSKQTGRTRHRMNGPVGGFELVMSLSIFLGPSCGTAIAPLDMGFGSWWRRR